jgi:hypothetical protein
MSASMQFESGRDSVEHLQEHIRDLEARASELRAMQNSPPIDRADELADLEVRRHALEGEIAELEKHPPRLFKGKHRDKIQDLRIDMKYLDTKIAKITSERGQHTSTLTSQIEQTESELVQARRELMDHPEIASYQPPPEREAPPADRSEQEAFYRDTMRPALLALMEARMDEDRLRFLDGYKEVTSLLWRMNGKGLDEEAEQKCRILYDYVLGFPCAEWYPGDPGELIVDLRDQTHTWNASADTDDMVFELALANGLMIMPLQVTRKLEHSPRAGDVPHRIRQIEGACPGAIETSERKCVHVLRHAEADWQRQLAEKGLDRLNQIRR